jgi:hypothetical protein
MELTLERTGSFPTTQNEGPLSEAVYLVRKVYFGNARREL